jgi:hypothetical protein
LHCSSTTSYQVSCRIRFGSCFPKATQSDTTLGGQQPGSTWSPDVWGAPNATAQLAHIVQAMVRIGGYSIATPVRGVRKIEPIGDRYGSSIFSQATSLGVTIIGYYPPRSRSWVDTRTARAGRCRRRTSRSGTSPTSQASGTRARSPASTATLAMGDRVMPTLLCIFYMEIHKY